MPPHPGFLPPHLGRQHDILAYMAEAGPDSNIFAIDVECVATGIRSSDRMPARVVILNFEEEVVLDAFIKPELPVVSCLTQLTGVTMENLEAARPLQVVQQQICEVLGPDAYVVGQSVQHDIEWMGLRKGQDYRDTLDVSHLFRVRKPRADGTYKFSYFSLKHTCKYLLHMDIQSGIHNPAEDALGALRIFKKFRSTSRDHVQVCQETLLRSPRTKSFSQIHKLIDGVALSREFDNLALSRQKQRQEHKQRQEQQQAAAAPDDAAEAAQASAEGTPASEAEKAAEATP